MLRLTLAASAAGVEKSAADSKDDIRQRHPQRNSKISLNADHLELDPIEYMPTASILSIMMYLYFKCNLHYNDDRA